MAVLTTGHGAVKRLKVDGSTVDMGCPPNSNFKNAVPSWRQYRGRAYAVGAWDRGIMVSEFNKSYTLGLKTPTVAPTLATGAAGVIKSAGSIGYYALIHKVFNRVLDESALSPPSATILPASQHLAVSGVPASFLSDKKATHWRYYRSDNGGPPSKVADIAIGTTTYDDNTATLALGDEADLVNRGPVPSFVRYSEVYAERMWYAGGLEREVAYFSKIGEPQSVGLENSVPTREGEAIVGMRRYRDQLLVGCSNCFYSIQLRNTDDLLIEKISPTIGLLSHHSMVDIHGRIWFASREGVYVYDGTFKLATREIDQLWLQEYQATAAAFMEMQAVHDIDRKIYKTLYRKAPTATVQSRYFCGNYASFEPIVAADQNSQPDWSMDLRGRRDSAVGVVSFGAGDSHVATGSCDGKIRLENDLTDGDDDGDSYQKALLIQTGANFTGVPAGGDEEDGHTFNTIWAYVESESTGWTLGLAGGDEQAVQAAAADDASLWERKVVAASVQANVVAKTVHFFPLDRTSGRGVVVQVSAVAPIGLAFRGFGLGVGPGPATRPATAPVSIVANAQALDVEHETLLAITLTADSYIAPSLLVYSIVAGPTDGTLDTTALPLVTYTPDLGFSGPDSFTFHVVGGASTSNTATISLTVA